MYRRVVHALLSRRARRGFALGGLLVVGAASGFAAIGAGLARETPTWWRSVRRDDPATISTAENVEEALKTLFTRRRDVDPAYSAGSGEPWRSEAWSFRIKATEVNAWLNIRLPLWLENQEEGFKWPERVSQLQVDFDAGRVRIGAAVRLGDREQIVSAILAPEIEHDRSLWTPARWVYVGRLAIPPSWVLEVTDPESAGYVRHATDALPQIRQMFDAFLGKQPASREPIIPVGPGRAVRVIGLEVLDGDLIVQCRTETR